MDTSPEYIKMCKEAENELLIHGFISNRKFGTSNKNFYRYDEVDMNYRKSSDQVWLPRQDQLQEMLKLNTIDLFQNLKKFCEEVYFINQDQVPSFEQIWLMIVMGKIFNKTWNKEKEIWIQV